MQKLLFGLLVALTLFGRAQVTDNLDSRKSVSNPYFSENKKDSLKPAIAKVWDLADTNLSHAYKMTIQQKKLCAEANYSYGEGYFAFMQSLLLDHLGDFNEASIKYEETIQFIQGHKDQLEPKEYAWLIGNSYNFYSITCSNLANYDKAFILLDSAYAAFASVDYHTQVNTIFSAKANLFFDVGMYDSSIHYAEKSIAMQEDWKSGLNRVHNYCVTNNLIALSLVKKGSYVQAIQKYYQLIAIADTSGLDDLRPVFNANIADIYLKLDEYEKALSYNRTAEKLAFELEDIDLPISIYQYRGDIYKNMSQTDSAISYYTKALVLSEKLDFPSGMVDAYHSLSEMAYDSMNYNLSISYANKGLKVVENRSMTESILLVGDLLRSKRKLSQKIDNKEVQDLISITNQSKDVEAKIKSYELIYKLLTDLQKFEEALSYVKKLDSLNKKLNVNQQTKAISKVIYRNQLELEMKRAELEKEKQAELYEKELEKERLIQQAAIGGGTLSIIILIILYRSYLLKKQKNQELSKKNEAISQLRDTEKKMAEETLALKERELTTITMLSHERNSLLQQLGTQIGGLTEKVDDEVIPDLKEIKRTINSNLSEESWSAFMYQFEKVHPEFFNVLKDKFSNLTQHDLRICAYLRVGMERKEIASITNTTPEAAKKSLYRLKKKMELDVETNLRDYLARL